ncbi:uncharacterized protein KY384_001881 [Bacidia gigantensis]|uniref:uncharacterized protein n=1 Tax=Bacidia gigantensis TaxID=2732470 RepID=UPI001D04B6DB|nr:uncharacterized protein KY384_001881 [Bacidia gigantensis]KAG8533098.1 hypothetical protein KY384_001881 [Bacidia gigantensis]
MSVSYDNKDLKTSMFFIERQSRHIQEKPYAFRYAADVDIPKTNFDLKEHSGIAVTNIRDDIKNFTVEKNGFSIIEFEEEISYLEYFDSVEVDRYLRQLERVLQAHLRASMVRVFRHAVRQYWLIKLFPVYNDRDLDSTPEETARLIKGLYTEEADRLLGKRFQWIKCAEQHLSSLTAASF